MEPPMNNGASPHLNDNPDLFSSQSSDEKMDTGSESFLSTQDTPNSVLSSDFDDKEQGSSEADEDSVLRLQNPNNGAATVLRLSEPVDQTNNLISRRLTADLNDSLVTKMSNLHLNSSNTDINIKTRPANLGISPPKFSSTLITTTNHPLMGLVSPDSVENYPDVIPKKVAKKSEEDKDLSLSSIEDDRNTNEVHSFIDFYGPQRNTSKNNLYISENFSTASESQILSRIDIRSTSHPDVARTDKEVSRRKIIPLRETDLQRKTEVATTPPRVLGRLVDGNKDESAILKYVEERNKKMAGQCQSTPIRGGEFKTPVKSERMETEPFDIPDREEFHSGVAEWCESPSHLRVMPNFQLPIEMSSNLAAGSLSQPESSDVLSSSTQEDKSTYQALLDPVTGSVALRHNGVNGSGSQRRKIVLPPDDTCSLDSVSVCSLDDEDPAEICGVENDPRPPSDDSDTRRNSLSEYSTSDPIPEYSAAEEFEEERAWMKVPLCSGGTTTCDMKVIEPYKRVVSHGGYSATGCAIIVFSACHLPDTARTDYRYVMDNLFLYVVWSLQRLVTDEYILVYLHGSAGRRRLPDWWWLRHTYRLIDTRLRKSLKHLYLVHPTFWVKTMVLLSKPFISSKFWRKLTYVRDLQELMEQVPVEPNAIPEIVKNFDAHRR